MSGAESEPREADSDPTIHEPEDVSEEEIEETAQEHKPEHAHTTDGPSHAVTITVEDTDADDRPLGADEEEDDDEEEAEIHGDNSTATESQQDFGDVTDAQEERDEPSSESTAEHDVSSIPQQDIKEDEVAQAQDTPENVLSSDQPETGVETRPTRSDSRSTTVSRVPVTSIVFVVSALETIGAAKEVRRNKAFSDAVQAALSNVKSNDHGVNPEIIFRPLQMATKSFDVPLQVTALDCIGKLISYSYFAFPVATTNNAEGADSQPLIERAIETICDCFENEATAVEIQQQIIKSLLAAVLDDKIVVHGAGLLKAVRQIYNIFIYSKSSQNQQVAQGSLLQMVATVFERVRVRLDLKEARFREQAEARSDRVLSADTNMFEHAGLDGLNGQMATPDQETPPALPEGLVQSQEKLTLQSFENSKNLDDAVVADSAPTTVTRAKRERKNTRSSSGPISRSSLQEEREETELSPDDEDDIYIKDAFLVFRSLCKLSQKVLNHDQQQDLRTQNMRSKLLSLHLIFHVINNYTTVFTSSFCTIKSGNNDENTPFLQVAKPHLCLSLSRNASSSVSRVYQVCCEIFWLCLKHMRVLLKKELEVFLKEVYLAVLERRSAPQFQKQMFMDVLERLSGDPRALVEVYLNYDCDRTALDNMYQEIIEHLSRICSTPIAVSPLQQHQYQEQQAKSSTSEWQSRGSLLPNLTTSALSHPPPPPPSIPVEYALKQQSLRCLVDILSSLDNWSVQTQVDRVSGSSYPVSKGSFQDSRESLDQERPPPSPRMPGGISSGVSTPAAEDDPNEIEKVRARKSALNEAIRQFNFKPKRGIKALVAEGFIRSNTPQDIAKFLYGNDKLDKAMLGEYLGEGDEQNIAVMHGFVDMMEFTKRRFVDALRQFLQSFRLPGEAQKIDRFMLKFAERYLTGNPNAFANADTAYVLAYSVIMLNTDQHSTKLGKAARMTVDDFIKNNRGINDGQDLPPEYLSSIFEEIANNEIVLASEREHAAELGIVASAPSAGLASRAGQVLANVGRDLQREKYAQASEEMANKTEQLYRSLIRAQKRSAVREALSRFIPATSTKHVGPMFGVSWMSFLSAFSSQMQDAQNLDLIKQCLYGLRLAIRISCRFDLETPRVAFVTALAKFTNLGNLKEMMAKNLEALKVLIDVALSEGDVLKSSWREILTCISQLDRLQLLSTGVDEGVIPDMNRANIPTPSNARRESVRSRSSMQGPKRPRPRSAHSFRPEVADETKSTDMVRGVDRIFTNTAKLTSEAILDFVRALSEVSWQEIQSSGNSESPRMFSLQKLVEISYYNMTRVRIEWARLWEVLGEHFNQVGCHNNTAVVFFALDSLRQLSMRFLEIEELPGFKFQKDFLKPFEHVMANSTVVTVKDMVLRCLIQMIQARGDNIRSGWKTMFGVFSIAAREQYEVIVNIAFDYTTQIYNTRFGVVISQGSFPDLIICLTEFSKNLKFQKKSLQAIELLKSTVPKMLKTPECPLSRRHGKSLSGDQSIVGVKQPTSQTEEEQFWYPVLIAYQDVLMTGEDLEVRSRALTYLFETLIRYGGDFPIEFWDVLWRQVLYPIFVVLQSKSEMSKAPNHEELSVWLSTTMIQALRNMITLFTHYFDSLEHMLDRFLDLLTLCICQENDTIARIGSNCLQQLILQNVTKFRPDHWSRIVTAFVELFNRTTAYELFSAAATMSDARPTPGTEGGDGLSISGASIVETPTTNGAAPQLPLPTPPSELQADPMSVPPESPQASQELEDYRPHSDMHAPAPVVTAARRRFFNKIITNCVLQLLMIETVHELFSNDAVYAQIPSPELLRLMTLLKKSYQFAKKFNGDKDLRMALWRQGFMRQPPNLLKQESGSANTYVSILLRMYHDEGEERRSSREQTEGALIPLCADIMRSFILLDEETQQRNIVAWRPVVIDVLEGYTTFPKDSFSKHLETFYPLSVGLLEREVGTELRAALWGMFRRVGEVKFGMPELVMARGRDNSVSSVSRMSRNGSISATPASPPQSNKGFESGRRESRNSRTGAV
ncbi:hypothetical protein PV11_05400 [Exophiala sideris]|uniref:SEC7 domain-containing protein n=1 Tax=Exophiala sideris TaxID=1016849 RepID=A0A0D1Z9D1_9EURO|nr:hypothetical protein PV11_05400 [Exophiala sideris]